MKLKDFAAFSAFGEYHGFNDIRVDNDRFYLFQRDNKGCAGNIVWIVYRGHYDCDVRVDLNNFEDRRTMLSFSQAMSYLWSICDRFV